MFGEKARRIVELSEKVEDLQGQLDEVAPFIDDAKAISAHVGELMQRPGSISYTASQIAAQAFKNIRDQRIDEARDQLVRQYAAEHQDTLYRQLLNEVREQEGAQIDEDAKTLAQTDAAFIETVRNKARAAVWQEALDRIAGSEKASVEEALLLEEERRIFFNEFNVRFKFDGEINLNDEDLLRHLKRGDILRIDLLAHSIGRVATLEMVWRKESDKVQGWSPYKAIGDVYIAEGTGFGRALTVPLQSITPIYTVGGSGTRLNDTVKDDMLIGIKLRSSYYQIRAGDSNWRGEAVATDCTLLPKTIESLDTDES